MNKIPVIIKKITLLSLLLVLISGYCHADTEQNPVVDFKNIKDTNSWEQRDILENNTIINILKKGGVDISYGEDGGTIFTMIDESLTEIIESLSTGKMEGFMDIALIQETMEYFGISPEEIVIDPTNYSGNMDFIHNYETRKS